MSPTRTRCSHSRPTWMPHVIASSISTLLLRIQATGKSSSRSMTRMSLVSFCSTCDRLYWRIWIEQQQKSGLEPSRVSRCSVCDLHVLQLPVCVFPPRREKRAENVPPELWGGATDLPSGRGLGGGFHRTEEGLWDLLLFHILPLTRYILFVSDTAWKRFYNCAVCKKYLKLKGQHSRKRYFFRNPT